METCRCRHVALGPAFPKRIPDAFEARRPVLLTEGLADAEEPEERIAGNVSCALKKARWPHLQARARQTTIGKDIDGAMLAIRAVNAWLKGVLAKEHARPALNQAVPGEAPFIDARKVGRMFDRNRRAFSGEDIARIAGTRHARQGAPGVTPCADEPGFGRSVTLAGPCGQGRRLAAACRETAGTAGGRGAA